MGEKKYLLTESDIERVKNLECGRCADNASGNFACAESLMAELGRFIEAHEHAVAPDVRRGRRQRRASCPHCGRQVRIASDLYCPACGARLKWGERREGGDSWRSSSSSR